MERSDYYIYLWTNSINGKQYVGRGRRNRAKTHQHKTCMSPLAHSIRKYGLSAFSLVYLERGLTHVEASARERHHIARLSCRAPLGYNLTDGGEGAEGLKHSEKSLARMREIARNRSPEHQEKINAARRTPEGRAQSAELGRRSKGRTASAEARAKMSAARIGKKPSPESVEKTRAGLLGRPKTPEHRERLAEANRGKTQSAETIAKKSESVSRAFEAKRAEQLIRIQSLPESPERAKLEAQFKRAAYMRQYLQKRAEKT